MKRIALYILLVFLSSPVLSQELVRVSNLSLKEKSDSLLIDYRVHVSAESIKSSQGFSLCAVLHSPDTFLILPPVSVFGSNKRKVLNRYYRNRTQEVFLRPTQQDTIYDYRIAVPYQEWMDQAKLSIHSQLSGYRGSKYLNHYVLKNQVDLESKEAYEVKPKVSFIVPARQEKRRRRQGKAYLSFQTGRSVILPNFRGNAPELQKIEDAFSDVVYDADVKLQGLYVEGFASPEGSSELNERLSLERATALKEYIRDKFTLADPLFKVSSSGEDWSGLAELVKVSELKDKDKILSIIYSADLPDRKEKSLKSLSGGITYRLLLKDLFPELRRVEYQIDYTVKDFELEESRDFLATNPEALSQEELYRLAMDFGRGSAQYNRILIELIPYYYNEDTTAANNAGAALLENGETSGASRYLSKAEDNGSTQNNRGVLHLLEGDLETARQFFESAISLGNAQGEHNLKELEKKQEDIKKRAGRLQGQAAEGNIELHVITKSINN